MRLVVQRVSSARVEVAGEVVGAIDRPGLLILAGVAHDDQQSPLNDLPTRYGHCASLTASDHARRRMLRFWWSVSSRSMPILARVAGHPGAQRHREVSASR